MSEEKSIENKKVKKKNITNNKISNKSVNNNNVNKNNINNKNIANNNNVNKNNINNKNIANNNVNIKEKILLHCCCAPCSTTCVERLIEEGYEVILFFSNDNIFPKEEYLKRFNELIKLASFYNLEVIKDNYDHSSWLEKVKGLESEKEGGKRCSLCFDYNLSIAYNKALELDIKFFTTTLTVSRYKDSLTIFNVGSNYNGFLEMNFKKKNGYAKSIQLSKELDLYRQKYCGCEYSLWDAKRFQEERALKSTCSVKLNVLVISQLYS